MVKQSYTAADIEVFSDIEGVKRNPVIYITSTDSFGLWVCFREIVDNARDEATDGSANKVCVKRTGPYSFSVWDDGRGIPIDMHKKEKRPAIEVIFCKLHAGGKMSHGEGMAYKKATAGTHGMGAAIVNALSSTLVARSYRNGVWNTFTCKAGVPSGGIVKSAPPRISEFGALNKGTVVEFTLDKQYFDADAKIDDETIKSYMKLQSDLHPGITFVYADSRGNKSAFITKKTLGEQLADECAVDEKDVLYVNAGGVQLAVAFRAEDDKSYLLERTYVCGVPTPDGGTHWQGFVNAIADALPNNKRALAGYFMGLLAGIMNVEVLKPLYYGQTKRKLRTKEATEQVYNAIAKPLATFFKKHKPDVDALLTQAQHLADMAKRHSHEAEMAKALGVKNGRSNLPAKLVRTIGDCKPTNRELFIVEGESALGTAQQARFKATQEILPLTGKVLNVVRNKDNAVNNVAIQNILRSIGYVEGQKGTDKMRVQKAIILLTDADADGGHIRLLLLGVLRQYLPQAFEAGIVYIIDTPLYKYKSPTEYAFGNTLGEIKAAVKKFDPAYVNRMKGWGGCNPPELRDIAFSDKRKLIRVLPMEEDEREQFYGLLQDDAKLRKQLLTFDKPKSVTSERRVSKTAAKLRVGRPALHVPPKTVASKGNIATRVKSRISRIKRR